MNQLKKTLGIVWMAASLFVAYFGTWMLGIPKLTSNKVEDIVFGSIILFILTPLVTIGLAIFGYYSVLGKYDD
jgi:hypothetical protein